MTPRERECLDAIKRLTVHGVGPTYQEIADHIGLASKSGAHRMVESLEAQGLVTRGPRQAAYRAHRNIAAVGDFDAVALDHMAQVELLALRCEIDRRLRS